MKVVRTLSIQEKVRFAEAYINMLHITDQDVQQDIYVCAIEFTCIDDIAMQSVMLFKELEELTNRKKEVEKEKKSREILTGLLGWAEFLDSDDEEE